MEILYPPVRAERRIHMKMLVGLHDFENAAYENDSATKVGAHGVGAPAKAPWAPNQGVSSGQVSRNLSLRPHVIYCKPLPDRSYSIRLELLQPLESWPAEDGPIRAPLTH